MISTGRHHEHRSIKTDSENIEFVGFRLATIEDDENVIYEEFSQADYTEVPLRIIPGKETMSLIEKLFAELEDEAENCSFKDFLITVNGCDTTLHVTIKFSQADRKVLDALCGCLGGFCLQCLASIKDGNDVQKIEQGFPQDRDLDDMRALFHQLYNEYNCQNLEEFKKKITSARRKGGTGPVCGRGFFKFINHIVPVLHTGLNLLKFLQELAYTLNARDAYDGEIFRGQGKRRSVDIIEAKKKSKHEFSDEAKDTCNLPLDR